MKVPGGRQISVYLPAFCKLFETIIKLAGYHNLQQQEPFDHSQGIKNTGLPDELH